MELYFLRHFAVVHRRHCNILEFVEHLNRWKVLANPAKVLDYDGGRMHWKYIVERLGLVNVDSKKIDMKLYEELRTCENEDALAVKLLEVQQLRNSGALEQRFKRWEEVAERTLFNRWKAETAKTADAGFYNKRFSHRHPMGVDVNDLVAEIPTQNEAPRDQMQIEDLAEEKGWWRMCWGTGCGRVKRWC